MGISNRLLLIPLILLSGTIKADSFKLHLWENQHSDRIEIYIDEKQALYLDHKFREDQPHDSISGQFPRWTIKDIERSEVGELIADLEALGVFTWESFYEHPPAEEGYMYLCSASWYLAVVSEDFEFESKGACAEPENLKDAVKVIFEFTQ